MSQAEITGTAGAYQSDNQSTDKNCVKVVFRKLKARSAEYWCLSVIVDKITIWQKVPVEVTNFTNILLHLSIPSTP